MKTLIIALLFGVLLTGCDGPAGSKASTTENQKEMTTALGEILAGDDDAFGKIVAISTAATERIESAGLDSWDSSDSDLDRVSTWEERAVIRLTSFYSACSNNGRVYPHVQFGLELTDELKAVGADSTLNALQELRTLEASGVELDDGPQTSLIEQQVPGDFEWAEPILEYVVAHPTRFLNPNQANKSE